MDVVGLNGAMIEAELLSLYQEAFLRLGIEIVIQYNSRKLMNGLFLECGVEEKLLSKATSIVDKLEKISEEEFRNQLLLIDLSEEQINKILTVFQYSLITLNEMYKNTTNVLLQEGLLEINQLTIFIEKLNLQEICIFTPTLARGQNYYTGNVFEVYEKGGKLPCSIGGGGRYDAMITQFIGDGTSYPAVGISFGLVPIYEILKDKPIFQQTNIELFIIPMDTGMESLLLARQLRKMGLKVEVEMQKRKLKKSLEFANKENIPYVLTLGEEEVRSQSCQVKKMTTGKETTFSFDDVQEIYSFLRNK